MATLRLSEESFLHHTIMGHSANYNTMDFSEPSFEWSGGSMQYNTTSMANEPTEGSFQSFQWAGVDQFDAAYTPSSFRGSSKETMSSLELLATNDRLSADSFPNYTEADAFSEVSQSSPVATMTYKMEPSSQLQEQGQPPPRPRAARRSTSKREVPKMQDLTAVDATGKPRMQRRMSDQSALSSPSSTNVNDNQNAGGASAANEAHIIAERRYRNNLNAKIAQIQTALQQAQFRSLPRDSYRSRGGTYFVSGEAPLEAGLRASMPSTAARDRRRKADILDEAAEYIKFADVELRQLSGEVQWLTQALAAAQGQQL